MRIIKVLLCLLTICQTTMATDAALAKILESLTPGQKTILYQYGTLSTYADSTQAAHFWQEHQRELPLLTPQQADVLATELLSNTELVYTMKKPSRLLALRGVFTASRLLLGLAALIGAYALITLLGKYIPGLLKWLIRYFSPAFRWLFSPRMLTWELFIIGAAGVYFGPQIPDLVIRTIVIHAGLFLAWAQLTAVFTCKDLFRHYKEEIMHTFTHADKPFKAFLYVSVPAIITSLAILWVIRECPDSWYRYEVAVPAMIAVFTLPPLRRMERIFSRLIFPFATSQVKVKDQRVGAYVVITLVVWVVMLLLPVIPMESLLVLTVFLAGALLLLSIEDLVRCGIKNYIWLQLLTLIFLCAAILTGSQLGMLLLAWTGLGGLLVFVLIKYWEIPMLLGWSWKNKKAWGALGMALLIWGIAVLIRSRPEWFALFPG
ncbi:hypothetical protein [Chitinophaga arvensicola]|uniref:Uncharacterized protein n=1 Tax=Chitinophaga arvensicola TaxID=29529 RepID=A0A1I0S9X3_9BACT|nr:hypothetical protein [Chitinophaga arvensicola]SEW52855.1 hypothetical protein SAMN04488122_5181 [Chitinophaga arvensicola]